MKKSTGWLLFGLGAAVTAAGAYYVYKNQEKFIKTEEVVNPDGTTHTKRTYFSLDVDNAKARVNETLAKTKEVAQETWKKVEGKFEEVKEAKENTYTTLDDTFDTTAEEAAITAEMNADAATEAEIIDEVVSLDSEEVISEEISDFSAEE
ncbi:MAG: hypothetical protein IKY53_07760 [Lachnospiraceae bacterium]|nr:hypothetical protein [Lachnospiraceae bacterium]